MQPKNIRIKDIAKKAGVSEGTVDRVLHNRGKVSESAAGKVRKVLDEINYQPNLVARTLGTSRKYRIATLTPDYKQDPYWRQSLEGIKAGEAQLAQFGIQIIIEHSFFDPHKKDDFQNTAIKVLHSKPDGVLIAPAASTPLFQDLSEAKIPFVFINVLIKDANPISYIGQDLFQSGQLAAELISIGQSPKASFGILHLVENQNNTIHLEEKEHGFREYLNQKNKSAAVHTFVITTTQHASFRDQLIPVLKTPGLQGIFITTSKAYRVASIVKKENSAIRIVGYDLIKDNLDDLQKGYIDFLINQNPMRQAKLGIQSLANYLLFKKPPPPQHLFPLEIITAQNAASYLSHAGNLSGITV
jgi:LacI family transcriptional regulator